MIQYNVLDITMLPGACIYYILDKVYIRQICLLMLCFTCVFACLSILYYSYTIPVMSTCSLSLLDSNHHCREVQEAHEVWGAVSQSVPCIHVRCTARTGSNEVYNTYDLLGIYNACANFNSTNTQRKQYTNGGTSQKWNTCIVNE